jgi:hypothetical protein
MSFWSKRNRKAKRRHEQDQREAAFIAHNRRVERLWGTDRQDLLHTRSGYLRRQKVRLHLWQKLVMENI